MADSSTKNKIGISSWACPTQEDDRLWQAMTREEQVSALRELANHPDSVTRSSLGIDEIRRRAHDLSESRRAAKNA
ncbi:MAG: hypothetical protein L3J67_03925 [Hyphomicrobiaceae bacterium]|nr:hypothetical protein [Hyphomicrobiaceae bacterium]